MKVRLPSYTLVIKEYSSTVTKSCPCRKETNSTIISTKAYILLMDTHKTKYPSIIKMVNIVNVKIDN